MSLKVGRWSPCLDQQNKKLSLRLEAQIFQSEKAPSPPIYCATLGSNYGQKHASYTVQSGFSRISIGVSYEASLGLSTVFANRETTKSLQNTLFTAAEMRFAGTIIVSLTNCLLMVETRYFKERAFNQALVITAVDVVFTSAVFHMHRRRTAARQTKQC